MKEEERTSDEKRSDPFEKVPVRALTYLINQ
jgi:hypothetical protein